MSTIRPKRALQSFKNAKEQPGTCDQMCFLSFSDQINFLQFFKRGDLLECWMHKMFRLGPALLSTLNVIRHLISDLRLKLELAFEVESDL